MLGPCSTATELVSWCFEPSQPRRITSGLTAIEQDGSDKRLVHKLACRTDDLLRQILFNLAIAAAAEAILIGISAEQAPSLQRAAPRYMKWSPPLTSSR